MPDDLSLVRQAIGLAADRGAHGAAPFGAMIIVDGRVVGTGVNVSADEEDPTAHAEVEAIRDACRSLGVLRLDGSTLASSCEPCALCHAAATLAGVDRILYAATRELATQTLGDADHPLGALLVHMQNELRCLAGDRIVHVPTGDDRVPFDRYLQAKARVRCASA